MSKIPASACVAALIALGLSPADAQPPATTDPIEPTLGYRSAFEGYRPFKQEEVQPWAQSNETVRQAGGWRAYAREASDARPPAQSRQSAPAERPAAGGTTPPTSPHTGHHTP
jgi:hypothetical protein